MARAWRRTSDDLDLTRSLANLRRWLKGDREGRADAVVIAVEGVVNLLELLRARPSEAAYVSSASFTFEGRSVRYDPGKERALVMWEIALRQIAELDAFQAELRSFNEFWKERYGRELIDGRGVPWPPDVGKEGRSGTVSWYLDSWTDVLRPPLKELVTYCSILSGQLNRRRPRRAPGSRGAPRRQVLDAVIGALRKAGMSVGEIGRLIEDGLPADSREKRYRARLSRPWWLSSPAPVPQK